MDRTTIKCTVGSVMVRFLFSPENIPRNMMLFAYEYVPGTRKDQNTVPPRNDHYRVGPLVFTLSSFSIRSLFIIIIGLLLFYWQLKLSTVTQFARELFRDGKYDATKCKG